MNTNTSPKTRPLSRNEVIDTVIAGVCLAFFLGIGGWGYALVGGFFLGDAIVSTLRN